MTRTVFPLIMIFSLFMFSCTTEVTLTLKADDSVDIAFEGGAGEAFTKMLTSTAGPQNSGMKGNADSPVIDSDAVSYELAKAGFSNVDVNQNKGGVVKINMKDKKQTSYIFSSNIIKSKKNMLIAAVTRKSLEDFYNSADEQTRMTLDLFLAPVFNNDCMSEEEYLEMVASFYGDEAAKEVSQSVVKINLVSKDGLKESIKYPLAQLMCGNL